MGADCIGDATSGAEYEPRGGPVILVECYASMKELGVVHLNVIFLASVRMLFAGDFKGPFWGRMITISRHAFTSMEKLLTVKCSHRLFFKTDDDFFEALLYHDLFPPFNLKFPARSISDRRKP
jgi:hypothetical protein